MTVTITTQLCDINLNHPTAITKTPPRSSFISSTIGTLLYLRGKRNEQNRARGQSDKMAHSQKEGSVHAALRSTSLQLSQVIGSSSFVYFVSPSPRTMAMHFHEHFALCECGRKKKKEGKEVSNQSCDAKHSFLFPFTLSIRCCCSCIPLE